MEIYNPYGTNIEVKTDGNFYKAKGVNVEYFSQFLEGVIAAFVEDINEEEIFTNVRDSLNYKSVFSDKLTKKNEGIPSFIIFPSKDYLY